MLVHDGIDISIFVTNIFCFQMHIALPRLFYAVCTWTLKVSYGRYNVPNSLLTQSRLLGCDL